MASTATGYKITLGTQTFEQTTQDGVQSIVFEDHVDMVSALTLRLSGAEGAPTWTTKIGDAVTVALGTGETELFGGDVTALEPVFGENTVLTVRALDPLHRLGRGRKTRFWTDAKDSDVVSDVGAETKLTVEVDATSETHDYIVQRNETNVGLLKRLAARNPSYQLYVADKKLHFKKASFEGTPIALEMAKMKSLKLVLNSLDLVQQVVVRGWDIHEKAEIVGSADKDKVTRIGGGELGVELAATFGDSIAYVTDVPVAVQSVANEIAQAEMERLARQFCRGSLIVQGDERIRAGTTVELSGFVEGYNGKYYVVGSRHVINATSGYTTEAFICSNTLGT